MHSRFLKRIAENVIATKKNSGQKAAKQYAQRTCDRVSEEEWEELLKTVKALKKSSSE